jgi:hypothetical protein
MTAPGKPITTLVQLRALVREEAEREFEASIHHDGELAFARPGIRIYRNADGSYRVYQAADYQGVSASLYLEALQEVDLERALVNSYLAMTPAERKQTLARGDAITAGPSEQALLNERPEQRESIGSSLTRARRKPTTRTTSRR